MSRKGRARTQESRLPTPVLAGSGSRVWAPCPLSAPMCSPVVGPIVGTSGRSSRNAHAPKARHWHGTEQGHGGRREGHCVRKGTGTHDTDTSAHDTSAHGSSPQGSSAHGSDGARLEPSSYCFCGVTPNDVDVRTVPCSSRTNHPCPSLPSRRPRAATTSAARRDVAGAVAAGPRAVGVAAAVGTVGRPDRCPSGWSRCSSSHSLGR